MLKKVFLSIALTFAFVVTAFGAWNGNPLKTPQQFNPSVVNIQIVKKNGEAGICTGSYFHSRNFNGRQVGFILTAGHCVPNAEEMEVIFPPDVKDDKPYHVITSKVWVRHARLLDPDTNGQVLMGDFNAHEIHDVAIIMVDNVPPHARPLPILYDFVPKRDDILYILSRKEKDKPKVISPFVSVPISNIKHLTLNGSTDVNDEKTSLLFEAGVIQPKDKQRGICPGDSGGAVVAYRDGVPYTVGTLSAMFQTFPITHDRVCGRSILYYGVSFNKVWMEKAIEHLLSKAT